MTKKKPYDTVLAYRSYFDFDFYQDQKSALQINQKSGLVRHLCKTTVFLKEVMEKCSLITKLWGLHKFKR